MKWVKFRIKTVTEAEDIIISTLYDLGLEGAQIEDKVPLTAMEKEQMFVDILPDGPEDDGIAYLSFFVEEKEDGSLEVAGEKTTTEAVLADVKRELEDLRQFMDIGEASVVVDETEDIDWINNWKQYFHQFYIDDILVIPSWENIKPEDTDKMVLHIDPGTAFGTGMHETTQLCIRQLRKFITPETELLDVGTGSGILAILSLMFGAKHAGGTDLDICAVEAVAQNCEVNGIDPAQFDMMIGNKTVDFQYADRIQLLSPGVPVQCLSVHSCFMYHQLLIFRYMRLFRSSIYYLRQILGNTLIHDPVFIYSAPFQPGLDDGREKCCRFHGIIRNHTFIYLLILFPYLQTQKSVPFFLLIIVHRDFQCFQKICLRNKILRSIFSHLQGLCISIILT